MSHGPSRHSIAGDERALAGYRAASRDVAVAERSPRGMVRAAGRDRVSFLQNMLTNDVKALAPGAGIRAALLTRQGKLVADLIAYRLEDEILMEMGLDRTAPVIESLSRYIVSEDVVLKDVSSTESLLSLEGPRAADLLGELGGEPLPPLAPFQFVIRRIGGDSVRVSAVAHGPGPGFDLAVAAEAGPRLRAHILEAGLPLGLVVLGPETMEVRRIEAGLPLFGVDMDESHLPLEAGLEGAISFNKGCYLGQEYVARLAHRGHVNKKLVGFLVQGDRPPERGSAIHGGGRPIGQVTSAAWSPAAGAMALGYVHRDFMEPGAEVSIESGGAPLAARVAALPFVSS